MSGHSKWSTIKRQKGANDAKRGAIFTKLGNAITISVREGGGGDPNFNFKLRLMMDKARSVNMPKENIARAIDRGLGKGDGVVLENVVYEGFAPHGIAVLVDVVTDNKNRASGEIRNIFHKAGGNLGSTGSVSYLFKKFGEIKIGKTVTANEALEKAMDAGAEDFFEDEDYVVYTTPETLHQVKVALETAGMPITFAGLVFVPNKETVVNIEDPVQAESVLNFLDSLEESDDVQNVYSNLG